MAKKVTKLNEVSQLRPGVDGDVLSTTSNGVKWSTKSEADIAKASDVKIKFDEVATSLSDRYTKEEINNIVANINTAKFEGPFGSVEEIKGPYDSNNLYLVGSTAPYAIYALVGGSLQNIGNTGADLSKYAIKDEVNTSLNTKVDKVAGKGLTEAEFTSDEKRKLANIQANAQANTIFSVNGKVGTITLTGDDIKSTENKTVNAVLNTHTTDIANIKRDMVVKDGNKVLSTNDFTNELKTKLEGLKQGLDGNHGAKGERGYSAYEIAQQGGYTGTKEEWLASLKGQKGDQGNPGIRGVEGPRGIPGINGLPGASAYEIAKANGFTGSQAEWLQSLKGQKGDTGQCKTIKVLTTNYNYDQATLNKNSATGYTGVYTTIDSVEGVAVGDTVFLRVRNTTKNGDALIVATVLEITGNNLKLRSLGFIDKGEQGNPGTNGVSGRDGINGKSAYQLALDAGFTGSVQQWLESLKGQRGEKGERGESGTAPSYNDTELRNRVTSLENGKADRSSIPANILTKENLNSEARTLSGLTITPGNGAGSASLFLDYPGGKKYEFFSDGNGAFGVWNKTDNSNVFRIDGNNTTIYKPLNANNSRLFNLAQPTQPQDAATKKYVDDTIGTRLAGYNMSNKLDVSKYRETIKENAVGTTMALGRNDSDSKMTYDSNGALNITTSLGSSLTPKVLVGRKNASQQFFGAEITNTKISLDSEDSNKEFVIDVSPNGRSSISEDVALDILEDVYVGNVTRNLAINALNIAARYDNTKGFVVIAGNNTAIDGSFIKVGRNADIRIKYRGSLTSFAGFGLMLRFTVKGLNPSDFGLEFSKYDTVRTTVGSVMANVSTITYGDAVSAYIPGSFFVDNRIGLADMEFKLVYKGSGRGSIGNFAIYNRKHKSPTFIAPEEAYIYMNKYDSNKTVFGRVAGISDNSSNVIAPGVTDDMRWNEGNLISKGITFHGSRNSNAWEILEEGIYNITVSVETVDVNMPFGIFIQKKDVITGAWVAISPTVTVSYPSVSRGLTATATVLLKKGDLINSRVGNFGNNNTRIGEYAANGTEGASFTVVKLGSISEKTYTAPMVTNRIVKEVAITPTIEGSSSKVIKYKVDLPQEFRDRKIKATFKLSFDYQNINATIGATIEVYRKAYDGPNNNLETESTKLFNTSAIGYHNYMELTELFENDDGAVAIWLKDRDNISPNQIASGKVILETI
jgi:collagen triple helix repeat protein